MNQLTIESEICSDTNDMEQGNNILLLFGQYIYIYIYKDVYIYIYI